MGVYTDRQWERAGVQARARSNAVRRPVREAVAAATSQGLVGVRFASGRALELARELGMAWPMFEGRAGSSERGFTVCDVRKIAAGV